MKNHEKIGVIISQLERAFYKFSSKWLWMVIWYRLCIPIMIFLVWALSIIQNGIFFVISLKIRICTTHWRLKHKMLYRTRFHKLKSSAIIKFPLLMTQHHRWDSFVDDTYSFVSQYMRFNFEWSQIRKNTLNPKSIFWEIDVVLLKRRILPWKNQWTSTQTDTKPFKDL